MKGREVKERDRRRHTAPACSAAAMQIGKSGFCEGVITFLSDKRWECWQAQPGRPEQIALRAGPASHGGLSQTPRSMRRVVKQVAFRNGTRNRTTYAFATVVYAIFANAVQ